jgi:hypothetical protein
MSHREPSIKLVWFTIALGFGYLEQALNLTKSGMKHVCNKESSFVQTRYVIFTDKTSPEDFNPLAERLGITSEHMKNIELVKAVKQGWPKGMTHANLRF